MKFELIKYYCSACGTITKAPEALEGSYGELVLRSRGERQEAYLNAVTDKVYSEFQGYLYKTGPAQRMDELEKADLLQELFGFACDLAQDGSIFVIGLSPKCANCGNADEPDYWEGTDPPEYVDIDMPHVTHHTWYAMSRQDKEALVASIIPDGS